MTTTKDRQLERLHNHRTAYELVLCREDARYLIQYWAGAKSRNGVLTCCRKVGAELQEVTGEDNITFGKCAADGATMGEWRIQWSGRTQREAIIEGELPFVAAT